MTMQGLKEFEIAHGQCVTSPGLSMDTSALTELGWTAPQELREGLRVLTYNRERDLKEWQPIQRIERRDACALVRIAARSGDVLCTLGQTWATWNTLRRGADTILPVRFTSTANLTKAHRIIGNAPFHEEGAAAASGLLDMATGKYGRDWPSLVMNMPHAQRRAWLAGFFCADGYFTPQGRWSFVQKRGEHYEAALAAFYTVLSTRISASMQSSKDVMTVVECVSRSWGCQKLRILREGTAPAWCLETANNTFVMRRGEFVTITGGL